MALYLSTSNYVSVASSTSLNNLSTTGSLHCWLKFTGGKYYIFGKGADKIYFVDYNGEGGLQMIFYIAGASTYVTIAGYATLKDGTWHMVTGTYNSGGGTNNMKVYIDGLLDSQNTATGNITTDANALAIGAYYNGTWSPTVSLFDCRLYNVELTATEIKNMYLNAGADHVIRGLLGRWILNESPDGTAASGALSVKDVSGNGNHGTPSGSPIYRKAPMKLFSGRKC